MTADWARLPYDVIESIANRLIREVDGRQPRGARRDVASRRAPSSGSESATPSPTRRSGATPSGAPRATADPDALLEGLTEPQRARRHPARRAAARRRRRRLGQDARPDAAHRAPPRDRRRAALRDHGDHLHQQGGRRDAPARRRPGRAPTPSACGSRPSTRRACACCAPTPTCSATSAASPSTTRATPRRAVERIMKELNLDTKRLSVRAASPRRSRAAKNEMLVAGGLRRARGHGDDPHHRAHRRDLPRSTRRALTLGQRHGLRRPALQRGRHAARRRRACSSPTSSRFKYLLVDEFQDTNGVQNELVMMLAAEHRNLCVVGDSDQSIYRFRAADVRNILQFEQRFPDADVILLEQNFRSTQTILDAANAVIAKNASPSRQEPLHRSTRPASRSGSTAPATSTTRAAGWRASCAACAAERRLAWNQMAVFYRTNAQSRVLEEEMLRASDPLPRHLGDALLRPQGDQDRAGLRATDRQPARRGVGASGRSTSPSAASATRRRRSSASTRPSNGLSFAEAAHYAARRRAHRPGAGRRREVRLHARRAARPGQRPHPARDDRRHRARDRAWATRCARRTPTRRYSRLENLGELASAAAPVRHADRLRRAHGARRGLRPARRRRRARSR